MIRLIKRLANRGRIKSAEGEAHADALRAEREAYNARLAEAYATEERERARRDRAFVLAHYNEARLKGDTRKQNETYRKAIKATEHALRMGV